MPAGPPRWTACSARGCGVLAEVPAALFMADFGRPVVWGAYVTTGILDAPDNLLMNGMVVSTDYRLAYPAGDLPGLDYGDSITVDGVVFTVREARAVDDGAFMHATLSKT